jgi:hypothetical protein
MNPRSPRSPLQSRQWAAGVAALIVVGLLIGFHHVVSGAVRQGELLRMSTANRAQAVWRCESLRGVRLRAACMNELNASTFVADAAPPNTVLPERASSPR